MDLMFLQLKKNQKHWHNFNQKDSFHSNESDNMFAETLA